MPCTKSIEYVAEHAEMGLELHRERNPPLALCEIGDIKLVEAQMLLEHTDCYALNIRELQKLVPNFDIPEIFKVGQIFSLSPIQGLGLGHLNVMKLPTSRWAVLLPYQDGTTIYPTVNMGHTDCAVKKVPIIKIAATSVIDTPFVSEEIIEVLKSGTVTNGISKDFNPEEIAFIEKAAVRFESEIRIGDPKKFLVDRKNRRKGFS